MAMYEVVLEDEDVEVGTLVGANGVLRRADDGFLHVEGCVQKHRDAGDALELPEQRPVPGIGLTVDGLGPGAPIHMDNSRNAVALVLGDVEHGDHERVPVGVVEDLAARLFGERRR